MSANSLSKWGLLALVLLMLTAACKDKKIVGPDTPNPGTFSVVLSAGDTLRYFVNNENIVNVRVFQGATMPTGVHLEYRTESNVGYIDDNGLNIIAQADTIAHPCGANPCLDYHCDDTTVAKDAVYVYAVVSAETVATSQIGFFLKH